MSLEVVSICSRRLRGTSRSPPGRTPGASGLVTVGSGREQSRGLSVCGRGTGVCGAFGPACVRLGTDCCVMTGHSEDRAKVLRPPGVREQVAGRGQAPRQRGLSGLLPWL